jgi:hypothetical protein
VASLARYLQWARITADASDIDQLALLVAQGVPPCEKPAAKDALEKLLRR